MDFEKLLEPFPVKKEAELIAQSIANDPKNMNKLWEFAIGNAKNSWRASWLMDKVYDIAPELIRPYLNDMIALLPDLTNESKKRQFLKIISLEPLPENISGKFINHCFDLLMTGTTAVAVQVYAMQILYNFSIREPDIQNELALILTEQMENGTAGFCSRARKILKAISNS
ncbi:hypothetical protein [Ancylomarina longa]|uniref:HEAT repeat domain-containing protein n=1 Tax=Ancylomarina longa TaxID=2487017 RepID=A0A434AZ13_9BACT|nr:hypothetical protein [Ancylomarina longa]RUT79858.1 hypothetical protein DLK05_00440 [Ancylomarina longa]